jgi:hypothetical protein
MKLSKLIMCLPSENITHTPVRRLRALALSSLPLRERIKQADGTAIKIARNMRLVPGVDPQVKLFIRISEAEIYGFSDDPLERIQEIRMGNSGYNIHIFLPSIRFEKGKRMVIR